MIKYTCFTQYVSLYINISLFHFLKIVLDSIFCPYIKFTSSTYTNKLACIQVSSKVKKLVGSQVYNKISFIVKRKITVYHSCVKTKVFLFITELDFHMLNTRPYVEESTM